MDKEDERLLEQLENFWTINEYNGYAEVWNNDGPHLFDMAKTSAKEAFSTLNPSKGKKYSVIFRVKPRTTEWK